MDFFKLWEQALNQAPALELQINYHKISDWTIAIGGRESDKPYFETDDSSRERCFAKAYLWLSEYLCEKYGGY